MKGGCGTVGGCGTIGVGGQVTVDGGQVCVFTGGVMKGLLLPGTAW
jgi:hypothetical protein